MPIVSLDEFEKMAPKEPVKMSLDEFEKMSPKNEGPSMARSALGGLGQSTTMGFGDELAGLVGSKIVDPIAHAIDPNYTPDTYQDARNFARKEVQQEQAANPKSYLGGEITGAIAQAVATGKLVPSPNTALGRIAMAMGYGGAQGLGTSNADLMEGDIATAAKDVGKGAAIGGATAGAFEGAGKLGGALINKAQRIAGKWGGAKDPETSEKVGQFLLDEGVAKPFRGIEKAREMVGDIKQNAWEKGMLPAYEQADELGAKINPENVAERFRQQWRTPERVEAGFDVEPQVMEYMGKPNMRTSAVDTIIPDEGRSISTRAAAELKKGLNNELAKFDVQSKVTPNVRQQAHQMYGHLNNEINQEVESKLGGEALKNFQAAKQRYGIADQLTDEQGKGILDKAVNKDFNTPAASGLDIGMAAAGGHKIGVIKQSLGALKPGPTVAWTAQKIGQILSVSPQVFGKFAPALQSAAARGGAALAATNFILSQNHPEYREMKKNLMEQKAPDENRGQ